MHYLKAARLFFYIGTVLTCPLFSRAVVGHIIAYSVDTAPNIPGPPPNTTLWLNEGNGIPYGTNEYIVLDNLYPGSYTVQVHTATSGYLPRESGTEPNAVDDPYSIYGNPRIFEVADNSAIVDFFKFDPVIQATATIRDGWTMERIDDASIEFIWNSTNGPIIKTKYPSHASYASNWFTNVEGEFPTNTILYLHDYDLRLNHTDYESFTWTDIITNASPGDIFNLGTLFLYPIDSNSNQISDAWEQDFFITNCNGIADADIDGACNYDEYIAGTDPTNGQNCLMIEQIQSTNGFELVWETEQDRSYCISGTTNLCTSNSWQQVAGPWEATNGMFELVWTETNQHLSWGNCYRVNVVPIWHTGDNSLLINTNARPVYTNSTGTGTNVPPTGIPPIP